MMQRELFIDGTWRPAAAGGLLDVVDPATEQVFARVAAAQASDVDAAVQAARRAFDTGPWPRLSGCERGGFLHAIGTAIRVRLEELATLEVRDNGKPLPEARWDVGDAAACFDYYASLAEQEDLRAPEILKLPDERFSTRVTRQPIGVVGAVIPWNYPLLMAAWKVAPALASGCTVVLKPSELTPLTALELARIAQSVGLPDGVLNVLSGDGPGAGQPLTIHPGVNKLAFTGSVATGSKMMQAAAQDIKRVSLELGGKSPLIVFADCDIEQAVEWILFGIFWNQGQVCSATSRVLVERPLYEALLARLAHEAARITIGNGLEPGVLLGPLVSKGQHDKVRQAIARGIADGGRLLCGGGDVAAACGYFVAPTIFVDMALDSWIWTEEIFGPVLCVAPFDSEIEALNLANNSRFGLAAAVMSKDLVRCDRVAAGLLAGIVWINCSQPTFTEAPWGGFKQSGIGRELGRWGFESYLEIKQITRYESSAPWGWYLKAPG